MTDQSESQDRENLDTPTSAKPAPIICEVHGYAREAYWSGKLLKWMPNYAAKFGGPKWVHEPCIYCEKERIEEEAGGVRTSASYMSPFGKKFDHATFINYSTAGSTEKSDALAMVTKFTMESASMDLFTKNILILYGNPGTGKTHLCAAAARHIRENGGKVIVFEGNSIILKLKSYYKNQEEGTRDDFLRYLCNSNLLILDDFLPREGDEQTNADREVLFVLFNEIYKRKTMTIFTTMMDKDHFMDSIVGPAEDRVIEVGQFVMMNWESYRTNREIKEGKS